MRYRTYKVTATNADTGREVTDNFYCTSERNARRDFHEVYRHGRYTITAVEIADDSLTDAEYSLVAEIARRKLPTLGGRTSLEPMHSDELDFVEVSVWSLEDALAAAYQAGKKAAREEGTK